MDLLADPHFFLHVGALVSVAALALRDQLKLRVVLAVSIAINALYHYVQVPSPAWHDLFWNLVTFAINIVVTVQLVLDRTHVGLGPEDRRLFAMFGVLTPGEYRTLVKLGRWHTAQEATALTHEGVKPECLFFVVEGALDAIKNGRHLQVEAPTFIGEIAFLRACVATATVSARPGTRFIAWPAGELHARLSRKQKLRLAVFRLLGADLAQKVARS